MYWTLLTINRNYFGDMREVKVKVLQRFGSKSLKDDSKPNPRHQQEDVRAESPSRTERRGACASEGGGFL